MADDTPGLPLTGRALTSHARSRLGPRYQDGVVEDSNGTAVLYLEALNEWGADDVARALNAQAEAEANAEELAVARALARARVALDGVDNVADWRDLVPPEAKARALIRASLARDDAEEAFDAFYTAHPEALEVKAGE